MDPNEPLLKELTRAYEWGRVRRGLWLGALSVPMTAMSLSCCHSRAHSVVLGAALAVVATGLAWRGGALGRGVVPGFAAGVVPLIFPALAAPTCSQIGGVAGVHLCLLSCIVGGLASGGIVAYAATRVNGNKGAFVFAAGLVAALAGSLGCIFVGAGGVVAMIVGLAIVSVPAGLRAEAQGVR
jgi:hypothetical protein